MTLVLPIGLVPDSFPVRDDWVKPALVAFCLTHIVVVGLDPGLAGEMNN